MYMIMRKGFVTIILLLSAGVAANMAVAQSVERHGDREHIEDMLERNRWGDARVELQEFIEGLDPVYDYYEQGWAEYQMVRSAVGRVCSPAGAFSLAPRAVPVMIRIMGQSSFE